MSTVKLTNPTDDELGAAVAEHVAGWKRIPAHGTWKEMWNNANGSMELDGPWFATSADAVLPLLEKSDAIVTHSVNENDWRVVIIGGRCNSALTLARAACIALLRANGIEVEVVP